MNLPTLAITIRSFNLSGPAMELVKKKFNLVFVNQTGLRLEQKDLISAIKDADYVLAGTELFNRSVLDASKKLKIISRIGIGIDNIDLDVAKKNHVTVFFTPNAPVQAVAEHTLALILSLLKHIPQYNSNMRNGDFHLQPGSLLSGKYIGIVGMGRIGSAVASSLSSLGCNIRYYDPFLTRKIPETWEKISSLEDLVSLSDILSIHSPPLPDGNPLITDAVIKVCKPRIIIINTARGSLLDEYALIQGLDSGVVSGAALDVFSIEPYDGPLLKYSQVIMTPHVSSNTTESRNQMEIEAVNNLLMAMQKVTQ